MKDKGTYGYINQQKLLMIGVSLLNALVVVWVFFYGFKTYETRSNIYTIMAVLMTIPLAMWITRYTTLMSGKSITKEQKDEVEKAAGNSALMYDLIMTVDQKLLGISCVAVSPRGAVFYTAGKNPGTKLVDRQSALKELLEATGLFRAVRLTDDWNTFIKRVKEEAAGELTAEQQADLADQCRRIQIYSA